MRVQYDDIQINRTRITVKFQSLKTDHEERELERMIRKMIGGVENTLSTQWMVVSNQEQSNRQKTLETQKFQRSYPGMSGMSCTAILRYSPVAILGHTHSSTQWYCTYLFVPWLDTCIFINSFYTVLLEAARRQWRATHLPHLPSYYDILALCSLFVSNLYDPVSSSKIPVHLTVTFKDLSPWPPTPTISSPHSTSN